MASQTWARQAFALSNVGLVLVQCRRIANRSGTAHQEGRMTRHRLSVVAFTALAVSLAFSSEGNAQFTATYEPLAPSPLRVATSWYSGAVTNDGKFIYGLGHSHNAYGDNSLWAFDPTTNSHRQLFPSTGNKWLWETYLDGEGKKQVVAGSGHWATLDPVADKALYAFFGGPTITALTNRNNHQAFYMPARNEFWVLAGTTFYQKSPYFAGRFSLDTNRWVNLSTSLAEFSAGLIAGSGGWVAPNAATAVCKDLNTVVLFGGMNGTGGVRIIEPNPAGPEPYRWALAPKPPIHLPAENVRHNAVCVGDTVYFISGQERVPNVKCCRAPDPGPFWSFHVPSRAWTRLADGPPGGYFLTLTYDSDAKALLYYGGSASNRLWVYDLIAERWTDLTGTVPGLPRADMHAGGFVPGFGHVFKGGNRYDTAGRNEGYSASSKMLVVRLVPPSERLRSGRAAPVVSAAPDSTAPAGNVGHASEIAATLAPPDTPSAHDRRDNSGGWLGGRRPTSSALAAVRRGESLPAVNQAANVPPVNASHPATETDTGRQSASHSRAWAATQSAAQPGGRLVWTRIPLPGYPKSPQGTIKHQRLVEGPAGRVYLLGGDWGGGPHQNTGRQEVYSFDPLSRTGNWRQEAPYCGTADAPVNWHTDEAGVAWDAKRGVFWKLAGTQYGPKDACLASGGSVRTKVIQFDPAKRKWHVPEGFDQRDFWYVGNGVLDPERDQLVQITDTVAWHLDLQTGQWLRYPLPAGPHRFNAIAARLGRAIWFVNRDERLESYDLDTHTLSGHGQWPYPKKNGWGMAMTFALGSKVLAIWPTSGPKEQRLAAVYDPATNQWITLDQGDGWGNAGTLHSSGRVILMGGGINGPAHHNKFVWVGQVK
ncbi:hypothetical protein [Immundisolibacter sp.]|uniref:hypothetical protein n=1 Tax=Immundisolibacter sp. TaxID=1934948 RepID=UPI00356230A7